MGQRLVVDVIKNDMTIAAVYFHWSAYSRSALFEMDKIIHICLADTDVIKDDIYVDNGYKEVSVTKEELSNISDIRLRLLKGIEALGGGLEKDEKRWFKERYPDVDYKKDGYSRSYGLVAFSNKGIRNLKAWAEGDGEVNFDERTIYNGCFWSFDSLDEINEYFDDVTEDKENRKIGKTNYDVFTVSFDDIKNVSDELDRLSEEGSYIFETPNGYCQMIE